MKKSSFTLYISLRLTVHHNHIFVDKGCVRHCVENMQRIQELSPIEQVEMFVTVFCFLKDSCEVSQILMEDFKSCQGYNYLCEFLLRLVLLVTSRLVWVSERLLFNANSALFQLYHWREQVNFQWDDGEVSFVLDQHAELDFYIASSLKQKSADRHCCLTRTHYPDS